MSTITAPPRLFRRGQRVEMRDEHLDRFSESGEWWEPVTVTHSLEQRTRHDGSVWWSMTVTTDAKPHAGPMNYAVAIDPDGQPRNGRVRKIASR